MNRTLKGAITGGLFGWLFVYFSLWIIACFFPWDANRASWTGFLTDWVRIPILHPDYIYGLPVMLSNMAFWMVAGVFCFYSQNQKLLQRRIFIVAAVAFIFGMVSGLITARIEQRAHPSNEPGVSRWYDNVEDPGMPGFLLTVSFGDWIYADERADDIPDIVIFNGIFWMNSAAILLMFSDWFRKRRRSILVHA
jgi:hypothetical protein